jgi:tetratricopeptide (TPR) repeat protein
LADQQQRLDLLDAGGDPRTAVRAVFSWSYRHPDDDTARAFRLAALHPGADFDPYAVAALTGTGLGQARKMLDALARAHLIQSASTGRYCMHDLLRAYARELAARDGKEHDAGLTRLFDHYLYTASMAMDKLYPNERHRRPRIPPPDTPVPSVTAPAAARAWLDAERPTLVAETVHAAEHGWPGHATRLAATLYRYLDAGGHYPEALTIHSHARGAAERAGDRAAEATALHDLSIVNWRQSSYQEGADHLRQALALFRQVGDRTGQARALANWGAGEKRLGRYDLAAHHYRQALAIAVEIGARDLECYPLINLGSICLQQGRYPEATGHLHRALALCREIGYRSLEANALATISDLCLRQGHHDEAARHLRAALALHRELGSRSGEVDALTSLGEVLVATGQPDHAQTEYVAALGLAVQIGDKYEQARAHHGLGQACHADGDPDQARRHWQQALALFTELGTPEADQVRAQLAAARDGSHRIPEASR